MKNQGNNLQRDPFWDVTTGKLSQWQHRVEFVLKSRAGRQIRVVVVLPGGGRGEGRRRLLCLRCSERARLLGSFLDRLRHGVMLEV